MKQVKGFMATVKRNLPLLLSGILLLAIPGPIAAQETSPQDVESKQESDLPLDTFADVEDMEFFVHIVTDQFDRYPESDSELSEDSRDLIMFIQNDSEDVLESIFDVAGDDLSKEKLSGDDVLHLCLVQIHGKDRRTEKQTGTDTKDGLPKISKEPGEITKVRYTFLSMKLIERGSAVDLQMVPHYTYVSAIPLDKQKLEGNGAALRQIIRRQFERLTVIIHSAADRNIQGLSAVYNNPTDQKGMWMYRAAGSEEQILSSTLESGDLDFSGVTEELNRLQFMTLSGSIPKNVAFALTGDRSIHNWSSATLCFDLYRAWYRHHCNPLKQRLTSFGIDQPLNMVDSIYSEEFDDFGRQSEPDQPALVFHFHLTGTDSVFSTNGGDSTNNKSMWLGFDVLVPNHEGSSRYKPRKATTLLHREFVIIERLADLPSVMNKLLHSFYEDQDYLHHDLSWDSMSEFDTAWETLYQRSYDGKGSVTLKGRDIDKLKNLMPKEDGSE
jgi:hypothetical protein